MQDIRHDFGSIRRRRHRSSYELLQLGKAFQFIKKTFFLFKENC